MSPQLDLDPLGDEPMLQESARRALDDASPVAALTTGGEDAAAIARRHWALAVEMGWPGLLVGEQAGGAGLSCRALALIAEAMGGRLFCGPFLSTAVLGATVADFAARRGRMTGAAAEIAAGRMVLSAATVSAEGNWLSDAPTLAVDAEGRIRGRRELVEHPSLATHYLAVDLVEQPEGQVSLLAALAPAGPAIRIEHRQPLDVSCPIASVEFEGAPATSDGIVRATMSRDALEVLLRPVHVAIAAELVGVAQMALDRAVAYARDRRQFGKPIGSFQAIKHRLADAFVLVENARLAVRYAAGVEDDVAAVHTARVLAADAALKAAGDYVQVQGGLGISWESDAHLYLKRARRLAASYGSTEDFRSSIVDRFVDAVLAGPAPAAD